MTHPTLTLATVLPVFEALVAENPKFVYTKPEGTRVCRYAWNGAPSCGVGQVLHKLGWSVKELEDLDAHLPSPIIGSLVNRNIIVADAKAAEVLRVFQLKQDAVYSWEESLLEAKKAAKIPMPKEDD